jgi:negative regulator of flagellin synthesis FlgM
MKIGPLDSKPVGTQPAERKTSAAPATPGAEASAQVALSSAATQITSTAADPTFDTQKVERIAQAIRDGQFKVNPEAIADKLIINAAELLGGSRKPS